MGFSKNIDSKVVCARHQLLCVICKACRRTVPDVYEACERFDSLGVEFQKKPDDGNMKGLAFIKDPDGYWIEILSSKGLASTI